MEETINYFTFVHPEMYEILSFYDPTYYSIIPQASDYVNYGGTTVYAPPPYHLILQEDTHAH